MGWKASPSRLRTTQQVDIAFVPAIIVGNFVLRFGKILRRLLHCRIAGSIRELGFLAHQLRVSTAAGIFEEKLPPSVFTGAFRKKRPKRKKQETKKKKMAASSQRAVGSRQLAHWNEEPCKDEVKSVQLSYVVQDAVKRWFDDTYRDAQRGDVKQQALLGQMLAEGYGCQRDPKGAEEWMEKARKRGFKMEGVYCQL
ncbi:hypothetical protein BSKO_13094 [Bryopsis sp. KO-2023]|nr:hypothetical protein BSKO_13094 [Bryopsis sp. KO-2023]